MFAVPMSYYLCSLYLCSLYLCSLYLCSLYLCSLYLYSLYLSFSVAMFYLVCFSTPLYLSLFVSIFFLSLSFLFLFSFFSFSLSVSIFLSLSIFYFSVLCQSFNLVEEGRPTCYEKSIIFCRGLVHSAKQRLLFPNLCTIFETFQLFACCHIRDSLFIRHV